MNFKDAYKSAEDEVHGDKALLHAMLNGEAKRTKRFRFTFKPMYSAAVAAVLVITCGTLYFRNGFDDHSTTYHDAANHQSSQISTDADIAPTDSVPGEEVQLPSDTEHKPVAEQNAEAPGNADGTADSSVRVHQPYEGTFNVPEAPADTSDNAPEISAHSSPTAEAAPSDISGAAKLDEEPLPKSAPAVVENTESAVSGTPSMASVIAEDADESTEAPAGGNHSVVPRVSSGGGGGSASGASKSSGGAATASIAPVSETRSIGIAQYWEHIGLNVGTAVRLPADMKLSIPSSVTVTAVNGEITEDTLTLTAVSSQDSSRTAVITVSRNSGSGNLNVAISTNKLTDPEVNELRNSLSH